MHEFCRVTTIAMKNIFSISPFRLLALTSLLFGATVCNRTASVQVMENTQTNTLFPQGDKTPAEYFTGNAFLHIMVTRDKNNDFVMGSVTFEPGARTNWHMHPKGQVLIVTEGEGLYQEKGYPAKIIRKGDVVNIPANKEHWHGANASSKMVHIALTNYQDDTNVVWLEPVKESEFLSANQTAK